MGVSITARVRRQVARLTQALQATLSRKGAVCPIKVIVCKPQDTNDDLFYFWFLPRPFHFHAPNFVRVPPPPRPPITLMPSPVLLINMVIYDEKIMYRSLGLSDS